MRKPLLTLMSVLLATSFLINVSTVADARHLTKKQGTHHKYKYKAKVHKSKYHKSKKRVRKAAPKAAVVAVVDVSSQTMHVSVNGFSYGNWRVSTGRSGFNTPRGAFRVHRMAKVYFSRKYDNAPMPYSLFFSGGNAIHGTSHLKQLGRPASHGCVRLAPSNAAKLFSLASQYGPSRTRIVVQE